MIFLVCNHIIIKHMPSFEDFARREQEPARIKTLEELALAIKETTTKWLEIANVDEHSLRLKELDILKALKTLEISEEWKAKNLDAVVAFIQVADTRTLIDELKRIFFLNSVPDSTISAQQVLDKINSMKNREN